MEDLIVRIEEEVVVVMIIDVTITESKKRILLFVFDV